MEDLNKLVDLVSEDVNRETIIELKHVLKIVEYSWKHKKEKN